MLASSALFQQILSVVGHDLLKLMVCSLETTPTLENRNVLEVAKAQISRSPENGVNSDAWSTPRTSK